jgi:hypothetical protein
MSEAPAPVAEFVQDEIATAELIQAAARSFNAVHHALKLLIDDVRRLDRHVHSLKAAAAPKSVAFHSTAPLGPDGLPIRRGRGRPPGAPNRNKHVYITSNGHSPGP